MKSVFHYLENDVTRAICGVYGDHLENLTAAQKLELVGYLGIWGDMVLSVEDEEEDVHWAHRPIEGGPDTDVRCALNLCEDLNLNISDIPDLITAIMGVTKV